MIRRAFFSSRHAGAAAERRTRSAGRAPCPDCSPPDSAAARAASSRRTAADSNRACPKPVVARRADARRWPGRRSRARTSLSERARALLRVLEVGLGVLLAWPAARAAAQPSLTIQAGRALEAIAFGGGSSDHRGATSAAGGGEMTLAGERLRLHYAFEAQTYSTPGDWLSLLHRGGATWKATFGSQAAHALFVGASVARRDNGESWAAAGYRGAAAFVNVELHPAPTLVVRSGYQADRRAFPDLPALDHTEQRLFGSILVTLPTRTTIIGEVATGWKTFSGSVLPVGAVPHLTGLDGAGGSGAGPGSGVGTGSGTPAQRRGAGRPLVLAAASSAPIVGTGVSAATARQVSVFARVAQSLAARLGLSVEVSARDAFGSAPSALLTTPAGFFDDGVYDDPYASDAALVRATLKRVWPSLAELSGSVSWFERRYAAVPALDLSGVPLPDGRLRRDDVRRAGVALRVPVASHRTGRLEVALGGSYGWLRHRSTDAFYRYTSHSVGLGLSLGY